MNENLLQKFGLTAGESKVYLALLKTGASTTGSVIKQSGVSHSKIYEILDRLSKKGLVGKATLNNRQYFEAKDPEMLKEYLKAKERELNEEKIELEGIMPSLKSIHQDSEQIKDAQIMLGTKGIKAVLEMALNEIKKGDTYYVLGVPKGANEQIGAAYFIDWHERRAKKGVHLKSIYNPEAKKWAQIRAKQKFTEIRILPSGGESPSGLNIFGDYVVTHVFGERPLSIIIKNREIAKSYINYFNLLWKISKKVD